MPDAATALSIASGAINTPPPSAGTPSLTPSADDLISLAQSRPGAYVPSADEAQHMSTDLAQIAARRQANAGPPQPPAGADPLTQKIAVAQAAAQGSLPVPAPAPTGAAPQSFAEGVQNEMMRGLTFGASDQIDAARSAATQYLMNRFAPNAQAPSPQAPSTPTSGSQAPSPQPTNLATSLPPLGSQASGQAPGPQAPNPQAPNPQAPQSFGDLYNAALAQNRAQRSQFQAQHPYVAPVANIAGALAMAPALGAANAAAPAATAAAPVLSTVAKNAAVGGAFGAASGFGNDQGNLNDRLRAAVYGAGMGAPMGAAAPYALPLLGKVAAAPFRWGANLVRPFTAGGQEAIAGGVLKRAAGTAPVVAQPSPLPGMQLSTGQATNNPGLLWLERSAQQGSPGGAALAAQAANSNNQALRGAIGQLGDLSAPNAAERMNAALFQARGAGRAAERTAWNSIDPNDVSWIPTQPLKNAVGLYMKNLPKAYRPYVPSDVLDTINNQFGRVESIEQFQALRSTIGSEIRGANAAGNANGARILSNLQDLLDTHLQNLPGVPPDMVARYAAARAQSRQFNQTFKQPAVRQALGVDTSGMPRLPATATADQFMRTGRGAAEAWQAYLNATGKNPAALDAARDAFAQKFLDAASTKLPDATGDAFLNAGKIRKFVTDYAHVISSPLFTSAQRDLITSIADAADMAARTARAGAPGGSDTYAKLSGGRFLDALIGAGSARVLAGSIGAGAGWMLGEGPGHAVLGALVGEHVGENAMGKIYAPAQAKILGLLDRAMHDPQLASSLMVRATPTNLGMMPPRARSAIIGALTGKAVPAWDSARRGQVQ